MHLRGRSEEGDHADTSEDAEMSGIRPLAGLYMIGERLTVGCDWFEGSVMAHGALRLSAGEKTSPKPRLVQFR